MKAKEIKTVGLVLSLALACTGCSAVYRAYPSPNLAKAQLALVKCDPKLIEVDGQTRAPRGDVYADMHRTSTRGPLRLQLSPGEHTFVLEAGKEGWIGPGTRVAGFHPDLYYTGTPVRFALKATLAAGKEYEVNLRLTGHLGVGQAAKVGAVSALGFSSKIKTLHIQDVAVLIDGKVVATGAPGSGQ